MRGRSYSSGIVHRQGHRLSRVGAFAGGFALAYFVDPEHGDERRRHAVEFGKRTWADFQRRSSQGKVPIEGTPPPPWEGTGYRAA